MLLSAAKRNCHTEEIPGLTGGRIVKPHPGTIHWMPPGQARIIPTVRDAFDRTTQLPPDRCRS